MSRLSQSRYSEKIAVRLSPRDKLALIKLADQKGMGVSEFLRDRIRRVIVSTPK